MMSLLTDLTKYSVITPYVVFVECLVHVVYIFILGLRSIPSTLFHHYAGSQLNLRHFGGHDLYYRSPEVIMLEKRQFIRVYCMGVNIGGETSDFCGNLPNHNYDIGHISV